MSEFSLVPLGQLAEIRMGQSPDSTYVYEGREQGVPFLQGNAEFGARHPAAKYSCTQPAKIAEQGSSLISVRAPVGETNIADQLYCIGRGLAAVKFHQYGESLGRELLSFNAKKLDKVSQGTTFAAIGGADLRTLLVADIPDQEAKTLERVLDTLDTQIQKTEALIAKLEKVKEGLLHDLLTRGIDENGQLRPSPEQAPELYKESPLGLIPGEWEAVSLSEASDLQVGYAFKSAWFEDSGIYRLLRGDNVGYGEPDWSSEKFLPEKLVERFSEYLLGEGDIVIGMDRTFTKSGAKITEIGRKDTPSLLVQRVGRFLSLSRRAKLDYIKVVVTSPQYLRELIQQEKGMDIPHLSKSEILSPIIPLPSFDEQKTICHIAGSIDSRISTLIMEVETLSSTKQALMDDLLTGRVRVTPLLEQAQATTPA